MSCKIIEKRTPWAGKGRQISKIAVREKSRKKRKSCNCHKMRGKHDRSDCR
jgi:hypothetical protein